MALALGIRSVSMVGNLVRLTRCFGTNSEVVL